MDGVHDLGGKQGFGPVDTTDSPFRHDWEWRQWALSKCATSGGQNLDQNRYVLEQIPAPHYLNAPYFEKWCLRDLACLVLGGQITLEEAVTGTASTTAPPPPAMNLAACRAALKANEAFFDRPLDVSPLFRIGDEVRTHRSAPAAATRLPAYARAANGIVVAHHGAHIFPDANAVRDDETAAHLYTVAFRAADLWPEAHPDDEVRLDLWEPHLDPA